MSLNAPALGAVANGATADDADDAPAVPMSYRPVKDASDAYQQVEATLLRQLLTASGAFKPSEVAGGQLRTEMFIETIADAVAKGGGLGIARMLEDSLGGADDQQESPSSSSSSSASSRAPKAAGTTTSGFGRRSDPIDGTTKYHTGIDMRAAEGTPIQVAGQGTVISAGPRGGYGNAVEIDHGGGLTTLYAHASELLVKTGEKVDAGQPIARVGQTGRATGPHLHFEVRQDEKPVNPTRYAGVVHRALNAYQRRAEAVGSGEGTKPRRGETP